MEFAFIKHSELTASQLVEVISIKSSVWNYTVDEHKKWIESNIDRNDYHLLISDNNQIVAYLNLVDVTIMTNSQELSAWGIGNVCVSPNRQGQNIGLLLMKLVDYFLATTKRIGILICRDKVAPFYERCHWNKFLGIVSMPDNKTLPYNLYISHTNLSGICNKISISRIF